MNGSDTSAADEGILGGIDRTSFLLALGTFAIGTDAFIIAGFSEIEFKPRLFFFGKDIWETALKAQDAGRKSGVIWLRGGPRSRSRP
jgi:hypothetical protein